MALHIADHDADTWSVWKCLYFVRIHRRVFQPYPGKLPAFNGWQSTCPATLFTLNGDFSRLF
jgi:hypothetical protein